MRWIKEDFHRLRWKTINNCWIHCIGEENRFKPISDFSRRDLEASLISTATEQNVPFNLLGKECLLNTTYKYVVVDDLSIHSLFD